DARGSSAPTLGPTARTGRPGRPPRLPPTPSFGPRGIDEYRHPDRGDSGRQVDRLPPDALDSDGREVFRLPGAESADFETLADRAGDGNDHGGGDCPWAGFRGCPAGRL